MCISLIYDFVHSMAKHEVHRLCLFNSTKTHISNCNWVSFIVKISTVTAIVQIYDTIFVIANKEFIIIIVNIIIVIT